MKTPTKLNKEIMICANCKQRVIFVDKYKKRLDKVFEWLQEWVWKNNTIPLKNSKLHLITTDGGWINGLELGKKLKEAKKFLDVKEPFLEKSVHGKTRR